MVADDDLLGVSPPLRVSASKDNTDERQRRQLQRDSEKSKQRGGKGKFASVFDRASVLGIPARAVTPEVQRAIEGLLNELDKLREGLHRSQKRASYLEELVDQDALLPVKNHRAFLRELAKMINRVDLIGAQSNLVYLNLRNAEEIKQQYGHRALEGALLHTALILNGEVRQIDVVGNLGGNGLGVVLAVTEHRFAVQKAQRLVEAVETRPYVWLGHIIELRLDCGVHTIGPGETVEVALDSASAEALKIEPRTSKPNNGEPETS